jgi:transcriptional regulator with XRE-family HTH domain
MTPFGRRLRELRREKGWRLKDMAEALGVSEAYLSALEHGHRGRPAGGFVQQVSAYFNLAWDDRLAETVRSLDRATLARLLALLGKT